MNITVKNVYNRHIENQKRINVSGADIIGKVIDWGKEGNFLLSNSKEYLSIQVDSETGNENLDYVITYFPKWLRVNIVNKEDGEVPLPGTLVDGRMRCILPKGKPNWKLKIMLPHPMVTPPEIIELCNDPDSSGHVTIGEDYEH